MIKIREQIILQENFKSEMWTIFQFGTKIRGSLERCERINFWHANIESAKLRGLRGYVGQNKKCVSKKNCVDQNKKCVGQKKFAWVGKKDF